MERPGRFGRWLAAGVWLALPGCGSERTFPENPPTHVVNGTLSYKGEPMNNALITFHSSQPERTARGTADRLGRYGLTTFVTGDGAVAGEYSVTIHWPVDQPPPAADDPDPVLPPDRLMGAYVSPKTSKLRAVVREEPNTIDFDLPSPAGE